MGCGVNVRVLPIEAQRAIKAKQDPGGFVLTLSHYDQNYEWYCATCQKLQYSAIKSLTLNFDDKVDIPDEIMNKMIDALIEMLNTLQLESLILVGKLDIFNSSKWMVYWQTCNVTTISVQDRLRTHGYIGFMKSHSLNFFTKNLVIKRDFSLNDVFYLYRYLLTNTSLRSLHLNFVETEEENKSNVITISPTNVFRKGRAKREPLVLVPADKMEMSTVPFQPINIFANNCFLSSLTLTGYLSIEMGDYLVNGLSLNASIQQLFLNNFTFNKTCIKSFSLCFAVNTSIKSIEATYGLTDESAAIFFHSLKYSRSITSLKLVNSKFSIEGFKQLAYFLQENKSIKELWIEDADNLGGTVVCYVTEDRMDQCDNLARLMNGLCENTSLSKLTIKLNEASMHAALDEVVFIDRSEDLCNALENALSSNKSLLELNLINLRFTGRLIDCIGSGLKANKRLKTLNLPGNLIDWRDLASLCESLVENFTLETLDIQRNRIVKVRDLAATKGMYVPDLLRNIKTTFKYMKKLILKGTFAINNWIFDHLEYPDSVSEYIKEVKSLTMSIDSYSTIVSAKGTDGTKKL